MKVKEQQPGVPSSPRPPLSITTDRLTRRENPGGTDDGDAGLLLYSLSVTYNNAVGAITNSCKESHGAKSPSLSTQLAVSDEQTAHQSIPSSAMRWRPRLPESHLSLFAANEDGL